VVAGLAALGAAATVRAILVVRRAEVSRVEAAVRDAVADGERRLDAAVAVHFARLETRAQAALFDPALVTDVGAKIARGVTRDPFEGRPWWQPYQAVFKDHYLLARSADAAFLPPPGAGGLSPAGPLIWSVLTLAGGRPQSVVAAQVEIAPLNLVPWLLLVQPFDATSVGQIFDRVGEAVVISDGQRPYFGAGPAGQTARLKQVIGHETEARFAPDPGRWAVAVKPVATGLWLVSHVSTQAPVARVRVRFVALEVAIAAPGGSLLALALFPMVRPRKKRKLERPPRGVAISAPTSVGRYLLLGPLGGGGMAEVHLAVSLGESGFRRPCVVKRLRPELAGSVRAVAQFTKEATLASSLVHANIVATFDFGREGSQYFLVQDYICGRDLGRLTACLREKKRRLPAEVVAHLTIETLRALEYAHGKRAIDGSLLGLVHRDVSPENIMVTLRGEVRLVDFGVVKTGAKHSSGTLTGAGTGALQGNLAFMAPEQARSRDVDARADLFSLALVTYFCLMGEPLYDVGSGYDLLATAGAGLGEAEREKIARLPPRFAAVLTRALATRPKDRYPDAAAFAADLTAAAGQHAGDDARARLAAIMRELFETELIDEQRPLAAASSSIAPPRTSAAMAAAASGEDHA
jgi:serine/threonine protein kinase